MAAQSNQPLKELKHDAVPGYPLAFCICFGAMTLYLAFILVSSPGKAEHHNDDHSKEHKTSKHPTEHHDENQPH